jgi:hypothetical protein
MGAATEVMDGLKKETAVIAKELNALKDLLDAMSTGTGTAGGGAVSEIVDDSSAKRDAREKAVVTIRKKIINDLKMVAKTGSANAWNVTGLGDTTAEEKQAVVYTIVNTLAVATTNSSQIDPDTASDVVETLASVTSLAKIFKVVFEKEVINTVIETLSSALDSRGSTAPNGVIRGIPDIIDILLDGAASGDVLEIKTGQITVRSVEAKPATGAGAWVTTYDTQASSTRVNGSVNGSASTGDACEIDDPVRVSLPSTLGFGDDASPSTVGKAGNSRNLKSGSSGLVRTTLVQYNAATHPFRSAADVSRKGKSTDILSIRMDYQGKAVSSMGGGRRRALEAVAVSEPWIPPLDWQFSGQVGRGLTSRVDLAPTQFINISFKIKARIFNPQDKLVGTSCGARSSSDKTTEMETRLVSYQTTDACGYNKTIEARAAVMPKKALGGVDENDEADMWCAWWSSADMAWKTDGCSIINITDEVAVHCLCIIRQPTRSTFHGDFGIVDYAFLRVARSFAVATPFEPSLASILVCATLFTLFLLLMLRAKVIKCTKRRRKAQERQEARKRGNEYAAEQAKNPTQPSTRIGGRRRSTLSRYNAEIKVVKFVPEKLNPLLKGLFGVNLRRFNDSVLEAKTLSMHGAKLFVFTWWEAMKLNHDVMAPFLAPYELGKGDEYYASMFLAKYAALLAVGTTLFHLHTCFSWGDLLEERQKGASNLASASWWGAKALLVALSLALQKIPLIVVGAVFKCSRTLRLKRESGKGSACKLGATTKCAWLTWFIFVAGCFAITVVLTSKGFLESGQSEDEGGVPCGCQGIRSSDDVESEWLLLLLAIVLVRVLVFRPMQILFIVCHQFRRAKRGIRTGKRPLTTRHLAANLPDPSSRHIGGKALEMTAAGLVPFDNETAGRGKGALSAAVVVDTDKELQLDDLRLTLSASPVNAAEESGLPGMMATSADGGNEFEFGTTGMTGGADQMNSPDNTSEESLSTSSSLDFSE